MLRCRGTRRCFNPISSRSRCCHEGSCSLARWLAGGGGRWCRWLLFAGPVMAAASRNWRWSVRRVSWWRARAASASASRSSCTTCFRPSPRRLRVPSTGASNRCWRRSPSPAAAQPGSCRLWCCRNGRARRCRYAARGASRFQIEVLKDAPRGERCFMVAIEGWRAEAGARSRAVRWAFDLPVVGHASCGESGMRGINGAELQAGAEADRRVRANGRQAHGALRHGAPTLAMLSDAWTAGWTPPTPAANR